MLFDRIRDIEYELRCLEDEVEDLITEADKLELANKNLANTLYDAVQKIQESKLEIDPDWLAEVERIFEDNYHTLNEEQ